MRDTVYGEHPRKAELLWQAIDEYKPNIEGAIHFYQITKHSLHMMKELLCYVQYYSLHPLFEANGLEVPTGEIVIMLEGSTDKFGLVWGKL
mmetsp:Transcript_23017/g.35593  ORF Transcript_23017/g.35593 Transcript_23017/m.35593 type:complete len:91 (+) Transcript_23017:81-353(+)